MNKKISLMVICVQKKTSVTKRVQNENYITIIDHFPIVLYICLLKHRHKKYATIRDNVENLVSL